ncbi:ERF family protein [Veillonella intestinalis]|uniref:ERF family protein n=1 Tax=Veillonella intestinalis TaxID=2941341 RepID=UPI00203E826F|nr:ERF family protein [Veillonella intestinalis]
MIEKLIAVQAELKAPKNQFNSFGKYKYRSCEDILEVVKPLLQKQGLLLTISDEIINLDGRYYVKTTATVTDGDKTITNTAYAREEASKKGMDASQLTGATSSYARKYALNGLFLIDDVEDADTMDNRESNDKQEDKSAYTWTNIKNRALQGGMTEQQLKDYCKNVLKRSESSKLTEDDFKKLYDYVNDFRYSKKSS